MKSILNAIVKFGLLPAALILAQVGAMADSNECPMHPLSELIGFSWEGTLSGFEIDYHTMSVMDGECRHGMTGVSESVSISKDGTYLLTITDYNYDNHADVIMMPDGSYFWRDLNGEITRNSKNLDERFVNQVFDDADTILNQLRRDPDFAGSLDDYADSRGVDLDYEYEVSQEALLGFEQEFEIDGVKYVYSVVNADPWAGYSDPRGLSLDYEYPNDHIYESVLSGNMEFIDIDGNNRVDIIRIKDSYIVMDKNNYITQNTTDYDNATAMELFEQATDILVQIKQSEEYKSKVDEFIEPIYTNPLRQ